jgi:prepilin-type N-terminal cleavage/methylation domain-containing protein
MARARHGRRGLVLIELVLAVAIGAILMAALNSLVGLGLQAQDQGRQTNELNYQARFALDRITAKARATAPALLAATAAGSTGSWLAPALYCLNAGNQLIETTTADAGCAGTTVIANNVSNFYAQLPSEPLPPALNPPCAWPPPSVGSVDAPVARFVVNLASSTGLQSVTLCTSVRLGGGTL